MKTAHPTLHFSQFLSYRYGSSSLLPTESNSFRYTFHGRYAIYQALVAIRTTGKNVVLLPGYDCPVVVEAVINAGFVPRFYRVGSDLSPDPDDLRQRWDVDVAVIIVTNFFGFPASMSAIRPEMRQSAFVIEDCAHSFLSYNPLRLAGGRGDISVYTFWKIVPCLVGGGLAVENDHMTLQPAKREIPIIESLRVAKRLLEQAFGNLRTVRVGQRYRPKLDKPPPMDRSNPFASSGTVSGIKPAAAVLQSERLNTDLMTAAMPVLSKHILTVADLQGIAESRRQNYNIYHNGVKENSRVRKVFREFPDQVCPWVFPIILEGRQRESLDYRLRDKGIQLYTFGSTLHPLVLTCADEETIKNIVFFAENLVCLSVHQDIAPAEIRASCEKINAFMKALD
jgi:perosamine synthetase